MFYRFIHLTRIEVSSFFNKLKEKLASKVTSLFSSVVIIFLLLHLFQDFQKKHLNLVSAELSISFGNVFAFLLLVLGSLFWTWQMRDFYLSVRTSLALARRLGEDPRVLFCHRLSQFFWTILSYYVPLFCIAQWGFAHWTGGESLFFFFFPLLLGPLLSLVFGYLNSCLARRSPKPSFRFQRSQKATLFFWRLESCFRSSLVLLGIFFAFLLTVLGYFSQASHGHFLISLLLHYLSGLAFGILLLLRVKEDFQGIWLERASGVSHRNYFGSLVYLIIIFGFFLFSFHFVSCFALICFSKGLGWGAIGLSSLRSFFVGLSPILFVGVIALQLDPRKFFTQLAVLFLTSFFFATGIIFHLSVVLIWPFIYSYGKASQMNRFYTL